ncbi:D123-domain-containing protein [Fistulina hepatica ATCC 64428]|uniref:D123-domain-containing protein n=1 Tax=Fistulina hepatica ATCC 64428 TaxID=1128425 RepID=A0A0D7A4L4_9AGAR|nr:D123-domain-containing protein [Fistulina hepatica ATCC 64428]
MESSNVSQSLFPELRSVLAFQFSSWYPIFAGHTIKSTIIRPLPDDFVQYLNDDGVYIPDGADQVPLSSSLSDDEDSESNEDVEPLRSYSFPEIDKRIRECIALYEGAVFPKLNFSSPRDAAWMLPISSPLKCTSPADVYMLLKSSDFVSFDLNPELVFEGAADGDKTVYALELVLRKWYSIDRSRELRCFVRGGMLIGISQRDSNYYPYMEASDVQYKITATVTKLWRECIATEERWRPKDYVFDLLLTRDLARAHIIDFNPYAPRTDALLFTYEELGKIFHSKKLSGEHSQVEPVFKFVNTPSTSAAPEHQHNMMPFEALSLSNGNDIEEFARLWQEELKKGVDNDSDEES